MTTPDPYGADVARIGTTGAFRYGPKGVLQPTGLAAFGADWADGGWISDEGITENRETDTTPFVPWQSNSPIRVATISDVISWETTLWTTSFENISLFYKVKAEDMTNSVGGIVEFTDGEIKDQDLRAFGIDIIDGVYHRRFLVPLGEVTERGSQTYNKGELIGYPVTVTAYPGAQGWSVKRIFKEGWFAPITKTVTRSAATAGTFTLTVDGQTTAGIAFDAAAAAVQTALEGLSTVGAGNVVVTGSAGGPYTVRFLVPVTAVSGTGTGLTPSGTITVA